MALLVKDPDASLDYGFSFVDYLQTAETISAAAWSVKPAGPELNSPTNDTTTASVNVVGGAAGAVYVLTCRFTTSLGRVDDRSITLRVQER